MNQCFNVSVISTVVPCRVEAICIVTIIISTHQILSSGCDLIWWVGLINIIKLISYNNYYCLLIKYLGN